MKTLLNLIFSADPSRPPRIEFLRAKKDIHFACTEAKERGTAVGIYCPALAQGMLLVGVDEVSSYQREEIVIFKPFDMNGIELKRTHVSAGEIKTLCPFAFPYAEPSIKQTAR